MQEQHTDASPVDRTQTRRSVKLWGARLEHSRVLDDSQVLDEPIQRFPDSPSVIQRFKWVRGELIGKGTRGRTYLGLNATTGEMMAVKQMAKTSVSSSGASRSLSVPDLRTQVERMQALSHPNLLEYFGLEEENEVMSVFMEYVPRSSIHANLKRYGSFQEDVVKHFTTQVLNGLAYLHSTGILHGELKASNILVESAGVCKISGLGCLETEVRDKSRAVPRAVFWTAPEVIKTQYKSYDSKADIWSTGCVVLQMFTGHRPWLGVEAVAVMYKLHQQTCKPPGLADLGLSAVGEDFMEKCLAIQPGDRMPAAELRSHPYLALPSGWSFQGFN
ncbi:kinase-like domain-containing protein [Mycena rebaudengoi]|nr:kinase-like domain-containing protein [Mycena rebaudengoi]